jgi:hypothetical protein
MSLSFHQWSSADGGQGGGFLSDPVASLSSVDHSDRPAVTQAYRFALDPTRRQVRELFRHAGAARVAFNWGLARVKANLSQRVAERSYGIADADLTASLNWSLYAMRKDWNHAKEQVAPWWGRNVPRRPTTPAWTSLPAR